MTSATVTKWDDLPEEPMRGGITRRFVHSDRLMVAEIRMQKGDVVPPHRHENEQFTYVLTGSMLFLLGEDQTEERLVQAGEIIQLPSNLLHSATALEDVFELDVFNPYRADWVGGDDRYLRSNS